MKKPTFLLLAAIFLFSLTACGQTAASPNLSTAATQSEYTEAPTQNAAEPDAPPEATEQTAGKTLVVYFSWSPAGNTEKMAAYIQAQTGGDLLKLEPLNPYPTDYSACADVAKTERDENTRPAIANLPSSLADYDRIFVGYPIWWHTAPMIIGTFLESFNLGGKEIYPFSQSASMDAEQFENSVAFVSERAAGANVHGGLFVNASNTDGIGQYLTANGFAK